MNIPFKPPTPSLQDTNHLVNAFLTSCTNRGLSGWTIKWYSGILKPFAVKFKELPYTPEEVEAYIGSYTSGDERRHGVFRALRTFYNFTCKRQDIIINPFTKISPPRVLPKAKRALSLEQLNQVLNYQGHDVMMKSLLHLLADTGIRIGEAARVVGSDIMDGTLKVKGKTNERIVPISPLVSDLLMKARPNSTAGDQRLFPRTPLWLGRIVSRAIEAAGVTGFNCHSFRHTFITRWTGSDIALKYITGHSSWRMLEHYRHERAAQAAQQHILHSPLTQLNGKHPDTVNDERVLIGSNDPIKTIEDVTPQSAAMESVKSTDGIEHLISLAQELGAAKETIKRFEGGKPKYDDLQAIMDRYTDYELQVPLAKYIIHALLYHFCRNALETIEEYARLGSYPACLTETIYDYSIGHFDPREGEPDDDKFVEAVREESRQLWSITSNLLKPFIIENQTQALIYKEICGDPTELETIKLVDIK